ncbi:sensor histidine kinase [Wukongibacter baidiensis]|uniref:ATP-binding protein n=1 Tax=Wukongibacter baidiensis TaxID=1723361 RepID=UPI003D7FB2B4
MLKIIKIRTKITTTLLLVGIVTALFISTASLIVLLSTTSKQAGEIGLESAKYNAKIIESWINERSAILKNTSAQISSLEEFNEEKIRKILYTSSKAYESFYSIFVGFENNKLIDAMGWKPPRDYQVSSRPWYQLAVKDGTLVNTPIYIDKNKNQLVTSIAIPLSVQNTKGVIAANIPIDEIVTQIGDISYGNTGYAILVDERGHVIASPNKDYIMKSISAIFNNVSKDTLNSINKSSSGIETIIFEGKEQFIAYAEIELYNWKIILTAPKSEFHRPIRDMLFYFAIIFFICITIITLTGFMLGKSISKPIESLIKSISLLAHGNLSNEINIETNDEIAILSTELDKMRINLNKIFQSMRYESNLLAMNTKKLSGHLEETHNSTLDFISMLSHDLKTPITLIKGYIKGLKLGIVVEEQKKAEYLDRIHLRAEQIENITSDILDSAYEVNKSLILAKIPVYVNEFAKELLKNAKIHIENSNRQFEGNLNIRDDSIRINVDRIKINRVWNNLISNAIKYSKPDTKINISIIQDESFIRFIVKDNGIGIKEDEFEKIFNMFYRVNENRRIKGYGLGLFISKAIIEAHKGEIFIESEHERGTTISFKIPICHKNDTI